MERTVHGMYWCGGRVYAEVVHYVDTDEWYVEEEGKPDARRRPTNKIPSDMAERTLAEEWCATVREP